MIRGVKSGQLDRRITIQRKTETTVNRTNEKRFTWTDLITVSAKRIFKASNEKFEANQQVGVDTYDYLIRYPNTVTITKTMRFVDSVDSQTYYITGIQMPDRKCTMILTGELKDNE